MDGTTVQANKNGIYKRCDRKVARATGTNWHSLPAEQRYELQRVDLKNRGNRYLVESIQPYLERFQRIPDGVCLYFEALHPKIG